LIIEGRKKKNMWAREALLSIMEGGYADSKKEEKIGGGRKRTRFLQKRHVLASCPVFNL